MCLVLLLIKYGCRSKLVFLKASNGSPAVAAALSPQVSLPTQYNNRNQDPVGALSSALARLQSNRPLRELREVAKGITKQLPQPIQVRVGCSTTIVIVKQICYCVTYASAEVRVVAKRSICSGDSLSRVHSRVFTGDESCLL
eukprot:GHRQ01027344.1.p2 GENE.GHRQ01027344.1~~GHRQ01027344.1.p2  ORF type:complete len:142 (-),score=41.05 GHRQ01027344.1:49-474(-)